MTIASATATVLTLGTAVPGAYQTFAADGVANGETVPYTIVDGLNWEMGLGIYGSSGPTLTRQTVRKSSNNGSAITPSAAATVFIDPSSLDVMPHSQEVFVPVVMSGDITTAVVNYATLYPGRVLVLPAGTATIDAGSIAFNNGGGIRGAGRTETVLNVSGSSAAGAIGFQPATVSGGATISNCTIRDLTLSGPASDTSGVGIFAQQVVNLIVDRVTTYNFSIEIDLVGCSNVFLNFWKCYYGTAPSTVSGSRHLRVRSGYNSSGTASSQVTYGVFLTGCDLTAKGSGTPNVAVGIELLACDGFYMPAGNYVGQAVSLLNISPENANVYLANIVINGPFFDGNNAQSTNAIQILYNSNASSVAITKVVINGCNISSFTQNGITCGTGQVTGLVVCGNAITSCYGIGLDMNNGVGNASVTGNTFTSCGTGNNTSTGGLRYSSNCNVVAVTGNTFLYTASGSGGDILAPSKPTHLQQGLNASSAGVLATSNT